MLATDSVVSFLRRERRLHARMAAVVAVGCGAVLGAGPAAAAAAGPPTGKYACYQAGFNGLSYYNGVTVVIERHARYTTKGAHFQGKYRYIAQGKRIKYLTGKLHGLRSWYDVDQSGHQAIYITFIDGTAKNTAVCGRLH